ncbi:MAG: hypothetical protein IKQ49_09985, partial [Eubacterium sp.]|nr:hypothetical protein [Eubacterium sp.]
MAEKKRGLRRRRTWERFAAAFMAVVMMLSLVVVGGSSKVEAANQGYQVRIHFLDRDEKTGTTPTDPSPLEDGQFFVLVEATKKFKDFYGNEVTWTTYAIHKIDEFNTKDDTTTIDVGAWEFYCDQYNGTQFTYRENANGAGHYDQGDGWKVTDVRLLKYASNSYLDVYDIHKKEADYTGIMSTNPPEGWAFKNRTINVDGNSTDITLYKNAFITNYELRFNFDGAGSAITGDRYYAVVDVGHSLGDYHSYYYAPITTDGKGGTISIPVSKWYSENAGELPDEKFTGREKSRTIYLRKVMEKEPGTPGASNIIKGTDPLQTLDVNAAVGRYVYNGFTSGMDENKASFTRTYYDTLNFTAAAVDTTYNYTNILGEALNYGVTANSMSTQGHFESNFATNMFRNRTEAEAAGGERMSKANFDPDLSGDGKGHPIPGTFLITNVEEGAQVTFGDRTPATAYVLTTADAADRVNSNSAPGKVVKVSTEENKIRSTVNGMISHMTNVSADLLKKPMVAFPGAGTNCLNIDISNSYPDYAVVYVDGDNYLEAIKAGGDGSTKGVNIKCLDHQLVVFNFDTTKDVEIGCIVVNGRDSTTTLYDNNCDDNNRADYANRHVVWNLASADKVNLKESGGIYLLPKTTSYINAGGTSTGWVVSAGHAHMGDGEFHYVYQGLTAPDSTLELSLRKVVNGVTPTADQKFTFTVEVYDDQDTENPFKAPQVSDGKGGYKDYTVENDGESILIPMPEMKDGSNVVRIKEVETEGYTKNEQVFYAEFYVQVITVDQKKVRIPGTPSYYKSFNEKTGELAEKLTNTPTFNNTESPNAGTIKITKTIKGDVTKEDLSGLKFEIFDTSDEKKPVKSVMLSQFTKTNPDSGDVKDTYTYSLAVDSTKTYYVVETLSTPKGFDVTVKYEVGTSGVSDGNKTKNFTVPAKGIQNIAYENDYKQKKGKLTVTKKIAGDAPTTMPTFKVSVYNSDTKKYYDKNGKDYDTVQWEAIVPNTPIEFKDLPVGDNYVVAEDESSAKDVNGGFIFVSASISNNGKVKIQETPSATVDITNEYLFTSLKIQKDVSGTDLTEFKVKVSDASGKNYGKNGKVIEGDDPYFTIKSTEDTIITGLPVGTYTVTEKDASVQGFTLTGTFTGTATISKTAKNATVKLVNNYKKIVKISKTDLGGTAVSGATIVLKDSDKKQIESWTSGETAKTFELEAGTYYFQETVAPTGYEKVDTEIEFTVDNSGNVTVVTSSTSVEKKADGTIVLKDAPKKYPVSISKTDLGGTALEGATIELWK